MSVLGLEVRRPRRTVVRKSEGLTTRFALASTSRCYAESSVRPLRRRAARMARPARVRMRRRKPCFLARRRLFGWKVRLLMVISPGPGVCGDREEWDRRIRADNLLKIGPRPPTVKPRPTIVPFSPHLPRDSCPQAALHN